MSRFEILKKLIQKHRGRLAFTYTLYSLEMFGSLLRPFLLGVAVNDLIEGSYHGLIILSVVHFLWLIIGTFRHMYDTRTFSSIYTSLVTQFLSRRNKKNDISKLSAHSNLSREFVDFLEYDLAFVIEAAYNILGSVIMLCFYDISFVAICFTILIPVLLISYYYGMKMKRLTRLKNNELEKQVDIISKGDPEFIKGHFHNLRKWQIKISDKEAFNFGIIEILVMVCIVASLLISIQGPGKIMLAGNIIGIYNYILKFVSGLDTIPYTVQRLASLNDITGRIELQDDDFTDNCPLHPTGKKIPIPQAFRLSA